MWAAEATLGEAVNSTRMRKWKWLFMNVSECRSPISIHREFLNLCQDGKMHQSAQELEQFFNAISELQ
jgi:hypothetical protein